MPQRWSDRLWVVRHGGSSGNVARDAVHSAKLARIDTDGRDVDVPFSPLRLWSAQMPPEDRPDVVLTSPYLRLRSALDTVSLHHSQVTPQGQAWCCDRGDVGLATSGSGDTLAGIIGGLLARGAAPAEAAVWGMFLHGEAGARLARRMGRMGFLARELPHEIPQILAAFDEP